MGCSSLHRTPFQTIIDDLKGVGGEPLAAHIHWRECPFDCEWNQQLTFSCAVLAVKSESEESIRRILEMQEEIDERTCMSIRESSHWR